MPNFACNRKVDWVKVSIQEGELPPRDKYDEASREAVKRLSPELKLERLDALDKLCRIEWCHDYYGSGIENYEVRQQLIDMIRGRK